MKEFLGVATVMALAGCADPFVGLSDALDGQGFDQRAAFVSVVDQPGGSGETSAIRLAALNAAGESVLVRSEAPFDDRFVTVEGLVWRDTAERLAAEIDEPIGGVEFDKWVLIYDRTLENEFSASDDIIAGDMSAACGPIPTPVFQDLVDLVIASGDLPVGTSVAYLPGSGTVIAGGFDGWLSDTSFVVEVFHEPEAVVIEPGGVVNAAFLPSVNGSATLGIDLSVYGIYEFYGGSWELVSCSETLPAIPPRAPPLQAVTVSGTGLLVDGTPLLTTGGDPLAGADGAVLADGSY